MTSRLLVFANASGMPFDSGASGSNGGSIEDAIGCVGFRCILVPVRHVEHSVLSGWSPDFSSSGQASPNWTRVVVDDAELVNGLEAVDWDDNPVQLKVCESCGYSSCEVGGYAGVHRIGAHLLLGAPWIEDPDDEWDRSQHTPITALGRVGAYLVGEPEWNRWRAAVGSLPAFDTLPACRRRELAWVWLNDALAVRRERPFTFEKALGVLRRRLVASDTLSPEDAFAKVRALVDWALQAPDESVLGSVHVAREVGAKVETLYCEGGRELEWAGLALEPVGAFAFSEGWIVSPSTTGMA